jgi:hypothetical protein
MLDAKLEVLRMQRVPSSSASPTSEMFDVFLTGGRVDAGDQTSLFFNEFGADGNFDFTPRDHQDSS